MLRYFSPKALPLAILALTAGLSAADDFEAARRNMVKTQIEARGVSDKRVLDALRSVPRHLFVPEDLRGKAYEDYPLPIGEGQTISQPYIVALMTELLGLKGGERVLEIGTGSGYQAAVLSVIAKEVYSIEIKPVLSERSAKLLDVLGYRNVKTLSGDGYFGWSEHEPFDCIMITAAVNHIPPPLLAQLKDGGRMVLPLGNPFDYQSLVVVTKQDKKAAVKVVTYVTFVPMTGEALKPDR